MIRDQKFFTWSTSLYLHIKIILIINIKIILRILFDRCKGMKFLSGKTKVIRFA